MPILTKPCKGKLSDDTQLLLRNARDRADLGVYPCEICGQSVGVLAADGDWVLERHFPSFIHIPRNPGLAAASKANHSTVSQRGAKTPLTDRINESKNQPLADPRANLFYLLQHLSRQAELRDCKRGSESPPIQPEHDK